MWARLDSRSHANSVWLVNAGIAPQLYSMSLRVGDGGSPVYMPSAGASASPYATLLGRPVIVCEQASALGDVGDIALVDLSQYALIEAAAGPQVATSLHVRFIYGEQAFRITMRNNGMPVWKSALSPYKGADSVSPFVTLAAR
jgi:HK97 family phage major capsid protein